VGKNWAERSNRLLSWVNACIRSRRWMAALVVFGTIALGAQVTLAAPAVTVKMTDTPPKFIPEKASIKVGQTIEWTNNAATLHSVDADPSMVQVPKDVVLPSGAKPFVSGFMTPGATFDYTFTVPGVYKYTCVPHEKDGMVGEIDVAK